MKRKVLIILVFSIVIVGVIFFLDYRKLKNVTIKLIGNETINLNIGDNWEDPGVFAYFNNEDISNKVIKTTNLKSNKAGSYTVKYKVRFLLFSKSITRKLNVQDISDNETFLFKLEGNASFYLMNGTMYQEPGYNAVDLIDGDLTDTVIKSGNVDINNDGEYLLEYAVKNSDGVIKRLVRHVIVYSFLFEKKLLTEDYAKENAIILDITDSNYNYTVLPNGDRTSNTNINYKIEENGSYHFKFYDKNNNFLDFPIDVTNIDKTSPEGTCKLILSDTGGKIVVDAKDDSGISEYVYYYGNNKEKTNNSEYAYETMDLEVKVDVFDQVQNVTSIVCETIDNSTKSPRSYTSEEFTLSNGRKYPYWFYQPEKGSRTKLPLMVYFHGDGGRKSMKDVNSYAYPNFVSSGMDFPFYMIAPHVDNTDDFGTDSRFLKNKELIDYIINNYNVDKDRIIIAGGSSGARGVYRMAANYKDLFSCALVGSGITYQLDEKNLTHLPIWFLHGENDKSISYRDVVKHVEKINALGGNAKYTIVPNEGHAVTEKIFKEQEVIDWIVTQKKK